MNPLVDHTDFVPQSSPLAHLYSLLEKHKQNSTSAHLDPVALTRAIADLAPSVVGEEPGDPGRVVAELFALLHSTLASHVGMEIRGLITDVLELAGHERQYKSPIAVLQTVEPIGRRITRSCETTFGDVRLAPCWDSLVWDIAPITAASSSSVDQSFSVFPAVIPHFDLIASDDRLLIYLPNERTETIEKLRGAIWTFAWKGGPTLDESKHRSMVVDLAWPRQAGVAPGPRGRADVLGTANSWSVEHSRCIALMPSNSGLLPPSGVAEFVYENNWHDTWEACWAGAAKCGMQLAQMPFPDPSEVSLTPIHGFLFCETRANDRNSLVVAANLSSWIVASTAHEEKTFEAGAESEGSRAEGSLHVKTRFPIAHSIRASATESDSSYFSRATSALRRRGVAISRRDWIDIVHEVDSRIDVCEVRDGFFENGGTYGKGVQILLHCACDPDCELDRLLLADVVSALELRRPIGIDFEIFLPFPIDVNLTIDPICVPERFLVAKNGSAGESRREIHHELKESIRSQLDVQSRTLFWDSQCVAFRNERLGDATEPKRQLLEFCERNLFDPHRLQRPRVPVEATSTADNSKTLMDNHWPMNVEPVEPNKPALSPPAHSYFRANRFRNWPFLRVKEVEIKHDQTASQSRSNGEAL